MVAPVRGLPVSLLALVLGCGGAPHVDAPSPPAPGACAEQAPQELPRSVLVELGQPGCEPGGRALCREEVDGAGFAVLTRVYADGRAEPLAGDREAGVQASDARALETGGYRYVRTGGEGSTELVTVDAGGEERTAPGGAARPVLLGGRAFADPSDRAGRLRAELSLEPPARARLVDAMRNGAEVAVIPLDDATPLERSPHVAAGGERLGILVRDGDDVVWLVREVPGGGDRVERRVIADAAATPLAVGDDLGWVAVPSAVRGIVVSGPDRSHTVPVSPVVAAAFDPCARWLYLVVGPGPQLLRLALDTGDLDRIGDVPAFVERLETTANGALLVGSSLPGGVTGVPRAVILSPFDGRSVEIPLPETTERVSDVVGY